MPRGSDFRTAFTKIGGIRPLTIAPFMALSASASNGMMETIKQSLQLNDPVVVSRSLDRPNIFISARKSLGMDVSHNLYPSTFVYFEIKFLWTSKRLWQPCITFCRCVLTSLKLLIYCPTKDDVCNVYSFLMKKVKHKNCVSVYHASLSDNLKAFNCSTFRSPSCI